MGLYLGIDTSNYTTSVALYNSVTGKVKMSKRLLPVKANECGLRQSDAVFFHVKQLGYLMEELFSGEERKISGVGYSAFPRRVEGSYMPCFLVGDMVSKSIASVYSIPRFAFSHQEGHIVSALYSAGCLDWLTREFYAFHVSGGTTEALLVQADGTDLAVQVIGQTLDLNAGQAVDRVGVMLGCSFPCGRELEQLALGCTEKVKGKASLKHCDCCLSGVQNQCEALFKNGKSKEYIAKYCLSCVEAAIAGMTQEICHTYGEKPILYAGGVMSNSLIRASLTKRFNGVFAAPEFSSDNSVGIAILTGMAAQKDQMA